MNATKQAGQRGFTLIELVVVIVILGILAAFAIPRFINISTEARVSAVNGLAGSLRSTSALLHGMWLVQPAAPASITVEGTAVAIVNGYPSAAAGGIVAAMSSVDGFVTGANCDGGITDTHLCFSPVSVGATVRLACSAAYVQATATAAARVVTNTTNCS